MAKAPVDEWELEEIEKLSRALGYSKAQVVRLLIRLGLREYRRSGRLRCGHYPCGRADCCGGALHPNDIVRDKAGRLALLAPGEASRRRASFHLVERGSRQ